MQGPSIWSSEIAMAEISHGSSSDTAELNCSSSNKECQLILSVFPWDASSDGCDCMKSLEVPPVTLVRILYEPFQSDSSLSEATMVISDDSDDSLDSERLLNTDW